MAVGGCAALAGCSDNKSDGEGSEATTEFKTAEKLENGTILQCFSWDFNTIKNSLPDIAAAGYSAIQTSPINECLEGEGGAMQLYGDGKWYYHYQPTDFKIGNYQLGTRDEFKAMCDEADKYGIRVIVDVIANHTTPTLNAVSEDLVNAGGGSFDTLFHKNNSRDISDYNNRLLCTTAKMGGLPDINTERPSFQDYFIKYMNDCIECGADGFRFDTAKHIGLPDDPKEDDGFKNNFWERITTEPTNAKNLFIYGEVLQGGRDRIADYIKAIGKTTASTYGQSIRKNITLNTLSASVIESYRLNDADPDVVTWVESHDNYINDGSYAELTNDQVILAWAIITARKDGTPLFFSRPYNATIENYWGMNRIGTQGDDMYKDRRVAAVNFFRTAMAGEEETLVNPDDDKTALIIERGEKGAVIVNTRDDLETGFEINLPDGEYIDRVDHKTTYTVKDGKLTSEADIPANSMVVLYNEGYVNYSVPANVGVSNDTIFEVEGEEATVTLTCDTDTAKYSLNGAEPVAYKDGETVTVKIDNKTGIGVLELTAENSEKLKTYEKVVFTGAAEGYSIAKGTKVYFEKPDDWDDDINIYCYNSEEDVNGLWPGKPMTKESDGKYSYEFEYDFENPYIIFNDGAASDSVQYPGANEQGLIVVPDKTYKP